MIDDEDPEKDYRSFSKYLVLSQHDRTMVCQRIHVPNLRQILKAGNSIEEVSNKVQFYTAGPTIRVGNVAEEKRAVQIYKNGIILLNGGL